MPSPRRPRPVGRLPFVQSIRGPDGKDYLYYRRDGRRTPLPGPEGSILFLETYDRVHAAWSPPQPAHGRPGTVDAAITAYLAGADFQQLSPASQRSYRLTLDRFRSSFGPLLLRDLRSPWWEKLRVKYADQPLAWNMLRSRMREVIRMHRRLHPDDLPADPLAEVRRLKVAPSDQNRPWPPEVLEAVLRAATPEFRALLVGYLLTAQRGGDVIRMRPEHYDSRLRLLRFLQGKTGRPMVLHVPEPLARAIDAMSGRHAERLFVTPRGKQWTLGNAQETLARLLSHLDLPRYTLHGLRATGPTALKLEGIENRIARELTGHTSDSAFEVYVRGASGYRLARQAQEELDRLFAPVLTAAELEGNRRRASGSGMGRPSGKSSGKRQIVSEEAEKVP